MDGSDYAIACDQYTKVRDNMRAIGLYLNEKRKMENRPVTTGQSEFATARLPPADEEAIAAPPASSTNDLDEEPHEILGVAPDAPVDVVEAVARRLSANVHPDGDDPDREEYIRIQKAEEAMLGE